MSTSLGAETGIKTTAAVHSQCKADICAATSHVRFTPNSDRKSGFPQSLHYRRKRTRAAQTVVSALGQKRT